MKKMKMIMFIIAVMCLYPSIEIRASDEPFIDEELYPYITETALSYGICPELICAIIWKESRWQPQATNGDCIGLMQISEKYHQDRMEKLGVSDLLDSKQNILVGVDYLAELFDEYEEIYLVLMKYNGSRNSVDRFYNDDISDYADTVSNISMEFEREKERRQEKEKLLELRFGNENLLRKE